MTSLWRYNPITGYWVHERTCTLLNAPQWLTEFQRDEPTVQFRISRLKPR